MPQPIITKGGPVQALFDAQLGSIKALQPMWGGDHDKRPHVLATRYASLAASLLLLNANYQVGPVLDREVQGSSSAHGAGAVSKRLRRQGPWSGLLLPVKPAKFSCPEAAVLRSACHHSWPPSLMSSSCFLCCLRRASSAMLLWLPCCPEVTVLLAAAASFLTMLFCLYSHQHAWCRMPRWPTTWRGYGMLQ